jgi:hypothetical protein
MRSRKRCKKEEKVFPCRHPLTSKNNFKTSLKIASKIIRLFPFGSFLELVEVWDFLTGSPQETYLSLLISWSLSVLSCAPVQILFLYGLRIYLYSSTGILFIDRNGLELA